MGKFDTRTVEIFVDVPGFNLDRATKLHHQMNERRALMKKQQRERAEAASAPVSNQPSQPTNKPAEPSVIEFSSGKTTTQPPGEVDFKLEL